MAQRLLILDWRAAGAARADELERALGEAGAERLSSGVFRLPDPLARTSYFRSLLDAIRRAGGSPLLADVTGDGRPGPGRASGR